MSQKELFQLSIQNQANYINFNKTDIVITTPTQFDLLSKYNRIKYMNPKFLVIDEADNLLDLNANLSQCIYEFLRENNFSTKMEETQRKVR